MRYYNQDGIMPWGQHRGRRFSEMRSGSLLWYAENSDFSHDPLLLRAIVRELQRRLEGRLGPQPQLIITAELLTEIRKRMALRFHPDRGGSVEAMKAINCFYDELSEAALRN